MNQEFNQKLSYVFLVFGKIIKPLLHALLVNETGYIYAGSIIKSLTNEYYAEVEEYGNDPNVSEVFRSFSLGRFSESELKKLNNIIWLFILFVMADQ